MTREVQYFCPVCQSIELEFDVGGLRLVGPDGKPMSGKAKCQLCGWHGSSAEVVGALSENNQTWWTPERVANALLYGISKVAAGPAIQLLELIGLVPKIEGSEEEQSSARMVREAVLKSILEAVVTAAFETAGPLTSGHYSQFRPELVPAVNHAMEELNREEPDDAQPS